MRRIGTLSALTLASAVLNVALIGTWAAFASDALPLAVAISLAFLLVGTQVVLLGALVSSLSRRFGPPEGRLVSHLRRSGSGAARRTAMYDDATGLLQRWYLEMRLQEEAERCRRYGISMAVIAVKAGSVGLGEFSTGAWQKIAVAAAQVTARNVRAVDLTAALGPMEFVLCLVHCDKAGAEAVIPRLARELQDYPCQIGVAVYPDDNCDGELLIELARGRRRPVIVASAA